MANKKKYPDGGPLAKKANKNKLWQPPVAPMEPVTVSAKLNYTPMERVGLSITRPDFPVPDIASSTGNTKIAPNFYEQMTQNFGVGEEEKGYTPNYGQIALSGLLTANALIPGQKPENQVVQPKRGYNPNPYGTGSQAIYKSGGKLSASKAKEMLKDGTANGKKLTAKQKRYFGWIAGGGKAEGGMEIGVGPDKPELTDGQTYYNPTRDGRDNIDMLELIGTNLASSGMEEEGRKALFDRLSSKYGIKGAQDLFTELSLFNQDANNKRLSPQERISRFFATNTNSNIKGDLNRYGYGAANIYDTSTNIINQKQQGRGLLTQMEAGGSLKQLSHNPIDGGTVEFVGNSHEKGGIDIAYGGKKVEVEGGETAIIGDDNSLNIMGNMKVLGTNKTFKQVSKSLAKKEKKYVDMLGKADELYGEVAKSTGTSFIDRLKQNTAKVMDMGGQVGVHTVTEQKKSLIAKQNEILNIANALGLDPIALSEGKEKKMRKGGKIKAAPGATLTDPDKPKKKSVAQRHNNPGNIKWNPKLKWMRDLGAVKGEPATDGGNFALFPDVQKGMQALRENLKRGYGEYEVEKGLERWTHGTGYNLDLGTLKGKKIKDLSPTEFDSLVSTITYGEDGKYYSTETTPASTVPSEEIVAPTLPGLPNRTLTPSVKEAVTNTAPVNPPDLGSVQVPQDRVIESDAAPMSLSQILPELFAASRNRVQPVRAQQFMPELMQDYQISLQDTRNANTTAFNSMQRMVGNNPAALSGLSGQIYAANNAVNAEEFRINQANQNSVRNANIQMLNDAQMKNLGLADQQYVRQSQAQSKTDAQNQLILNSIAAKELQHTANNRRLSIYENLYDFRFDETGKAEYEGADAVFTQENNPVTGTGRYTATMAEYDAQGNLKKTRTRTPSPAQQEEQELKNQRRSMSIPLLREVNRVFNRRS